MEKPVPPRASRGAPIFEAPGLAGYLVEVREHGTAAGRN